ncbi:MAG: hypothetical protein ACLR43_07115 [Faecalibacillus faecis]
MQKAIIVCLSKQKDEIINLLQLNDYSFEPLLSNEQLYLIGDIEEYQINLLINIIKHYKIIRNETQLYISYRRYKNEYFIY